MKTFYSAADIETLASQGVHELLVDEDTVLTSVAREAATRLGFRLVTPGAARPAGGTEVRPAVAAAPAGGKPRGCQHGPLNMNGSASAPAESANGNAPANRGARTAGSPIVDDLVGAVKQFASRPSQGKEG